MAKVPPDPPNSPAVCRYCGVGFIPKRKGRDTFCSNACIANNTSVQWLASSRSPQPGDRFGEWTVLYYAYTEQKYGRKWHLYQCRCSCGKEFLIPASYLSRGTSQRCRPCASNLNRPMTHGASCGGKRTLEYKIWDGMRQRCNNPRNAAWSHYGGRGIKICARWESFENFLVDMGKRPGPDYSLDRLDNDSGYEPGNCAWRTAEAQSNNRRGLRLLEFRGETLSLAQWARRQGLSESALRIRLKAGWPIEAALLTPLDKSKVPKGKEKKP